MQTPQAVLLLFYPAHAFKSIKFYLFQGENTVSGNQTTVISIPDPSLQGQTAVITLHRNRIVTIRDNSANKKPWLHKLCSLPPIERVILEMDRDYQILPEREFWLGNWRGLYKGDSLQNLKLLQNVLNRDLAYKCQDLTQQDQDSHNKSLEPLSNRLHSREQIGLPQQLGATLLVFQNNIQQTLIVQPPASTMPNNFIQPTLIISDIGSTLVVNQYGNPCEYPLDATLIVNQHVLQPTLLINYQYQSIKPNVQPVMLVNNLSATFIQENQINQSLQQTFLQTESQPASNYQKIELKLAPSRTQEILRAMGQDIKSRLNNQRSVQPQSLFDLLGNDQDSRKTVKRVQQILPELKKNIQTVIKSQNPKRKVCFSGFRPSQSQKEISRKMGLQNMEDGEADFDILLIKELKLTTKLLIAIVKGIPIYTKEYLYKRIATPIGSILGHPWEQIMRRAQNPLKHKIFQKQKFYVSASILNKDLPKLIQLMGGLILKRISKVSVINVVLAKEDREQFQQYRNNKNITLISQEAIHQSALLSEQIKEKHRVDELFFI